MITHRLIDILATGCYALALSALTVGVALAADEPPPGTMRVDLAHRSPAIHWPDGFDPVSADLFSHNDIQVNATCERVWGFIVRAPEWPRWYPNAKDVRLVAGGITELTANSVFRWTTFGLAIESKIHEFVPYSRIGWYGYVPGQPPSFYHTWYLTPLPQGCNVAMDEVGKGRDAARLRRQNEGLMHQGHEMWLVTLKWMVEHTQP